MRNNFQRGLELVLAGAIGCAAGYAIKDNFDPSHPIDSLKRIMLPDNRARIEGVGVIYEGKAAQEFLRKIGYDTLDFSLDMERVQTVEWSDFSRIVGQEEGCHDLYHHLAIRYGLVVKHGDGRVTSLRTTGNPGSGGVMDKFEAFTSEGRAFASYERYGSDKNETARVVGQKFFDESRNKFRWSGM